MRIGFELHHMNLKANKALVNHIYESSKVKGDRDNIHPLSIICDSMKYDHALNISTYIKDNRTDAYVVINFNEWDDNQKIKEISKRFEKSAKLVLKAQVVKVYEKLQ